MDKDIVFKTTPFGGFRKSEVMDYISALIIEKGEADTKILELYTYNGELVQKNKKLENMLSAAESLKKQNAELKGKIESLKAELSEAEELKNEITKLTASLNEEMLKNEELQLTVEDLNTSLLEEKRKNEELSAKLLSYTQNPCNAEALIKENNELRAEAEKFRLMENQVGAAMLDARVHSDELIKEAKAKADSTTKKVYDAIGETALRIDSLSSDISDIARSFSKSAEEVELRINVLTGNMSKAAQLLISDNITSQKTIFGESPDEEL